MARHGSALKIDSRYASLNQRRCLRCHVRFCFSLVRKHQRSCRQGPIERIAVGVRLYGGVAADRQRDRHCLASDRVVSCRRTEVRIRRLARDISVRRIGLDATGLMLKRPVRSADILSLVPLIGFIELRTNRSVRRQSRADWVVKASETGSWIRLRATAPSTAITTVATQAAIKLRIRSSWLSNPVLIEVRYRFRKDQETGVNHGCQRWLRPPDRLARQNRSNLREATFRHYRPCSSSRSRR